MGGSSSSSSNTTTNINTNISNNMLNILNQNTNNLIANTVVEQASNCSASISQLQNVTIENVDTGGNLIIGEVDQNQSAALSFSCLNESSVNSAVNSEVLNKMLSSLNNTFNAASLAKIAQEAAASASGQSLSFGGGSSSNSSNNVTNQNTNINNINQELKNILTTNITNNLNSSSINNCISKVSAQQNFSLLNSKIGGNVQIGVISQNQASKSMSECVQGSKVANSLTGKILSEFGIHTVSESEYNNQLQSNQSSTSKSESTGLLTELGNAIAGIVTSIGSAISDVISAAQLGPIVSVIACILVLGFILWIIFSGKNKKESSNNYDEDDSEEIDETN
jgi:hypothetical protein